MKLHYVFHLQGGNHFIRIACKDLAQVILTANIALCIMTKIYPSASVWWEHELMVEVPGQEHRPWRSDNGETFAEVYGCSSIRNFRFENGCNAWTVRSFVNYISRVKQTSLKTNDLVRHVEATLLPFDTEAPRLSEEELENCL